VAISSPAPSDPVLAVPEAPATALLLRRALTRHPTLIVGALVLLFVLMAGVFAPAWWTGDPQGMRPAQRLRPPSAERWFGSDHFGRDIYTRTLYGTRISLSVGSAVSILSLVLGTSLGLVIAFYRRVDAVCMRVMDGLMAIPAILLALALMALMRASVRNVIIALLIPEIPRVVRVVRSSSCRCADGHGQGRAPRRGYPASSRYILSLAPLLVRPPLTSALLFSLPRFARAPPTFRRGATS
jgi:peptide/nickel transport system permease protein